MGDKLLSIASSLSPSQQLTIQQLENNNYPLNNNISKVIKIFVNATTSKKSPVEREADEIVQVLIKEYKLFGSREISNSSNNTIVKLGNLNKDFTKFIKAQKIALATEILKQSQEKTITE